MAWYHRRLCIDQMKDIDLNDELKWLDSIGVDNQKNYQIWQHRKMIVEKSGNYSHEIPLINEVLEDEPKNFHAWCHRIWVVRRFNILNGEFDFIDHMLEEDIRNNSVWNYRFFLVNHINESVYDTWSNEINYAFDKIIQVPNSECPYNYIRGIIAQNKYTYSQFPIIKETLTNIIENSFQLTLLLDVYEEDMNIEKCDSIIDKLVDIDYIRKKYFLWRKQNLHNI